MWLQRRWYDKRLHPLLYLLAPLSLLFWLLTNLRRSLYRFGLLRTHKSDVPVIVVGNISVGGTGKTPLTIALVECLKAQGYRPGIVSRGYGAQANFPHTVSVDDDAATAGDEPLMLRRKCECPVVTSPRRVEAIQALRQQYPDVDVIISDDGLQHYAMHRDIELILIDAERGIGNGWLLPCGPLREGPWRLKGAEWVLSLYAQHPFAQYVVEVTPQPWRRVIDNESVAAPPTPCYAIAGIGNPHRFFHGLRQQGIEPERCLEFPDHHKFTPADFAEAAGKTILMTEKDAAKCREFAADNWFYQPIAAQLPDDLSAKLTQQLRKLSA
ncbi:tetraacyldisaccharide 4'-kinase [Idiomarina sp. OT37-5b]|uniref:Tetraacyldisaccharide 4'-kinase n=1 Tax=Idiomarina aquatica TaxID=1327752 RepID=A0AA94EEW2_9GAMM|nr:MULTISPECIES: tetraacyldisaccharide 4'-kinase [Idiomarina]AVJ56178.1 tetraacyldisaccharide 4'-kinase [Idiomarina sp. OT37-5b]RUO43304.1 tetraacyldisaccharide 4'-kinase [Idiomarina aquatica]